MQPTCPLCILPFLGKEQVLKRQVKPFGAVGSAILPTPSWASLCPVFCQGPFHGHVSDHLSALCCAKGASSLVASEINTKLFFPPQEFCFHEYVSPRSSSCLVSGWVRIGGETERSRGGSREGGFVSPFCSLFHPPKAGSQTSKGGSAWGQLVKPGSREGGKR